MSAVEVIRRFYQAMHTLDPAGLLETLADDFVGHVSEGLPGGFGGTYVGADRMLRECWGPVHQRFGVLPHPREILTTHQGQVVAVGEYRGTVPRTGRRIVAAFAHVFRMRADRIVELRQITDTAQWAYAVA